MVYESPNCESGYQAQAERPLIPASPRMDSPMYPQAPGGAIRPLGFRARGRGAQSRLAPRADEATFIGSAVLRRLRVTNRHVRGKTDYQPSRAIWVPAPGTSSPFSPASSRPIELGFADARFGSAFRRQPAREPSPSSKAGTTLGAATRPLDSPSPIDYEISHRSSPGLAQILDCPRNRGGFMCLGDYDVVVVGAGYAAHAASVPSSSSPISRE
jgi:hypothetical protein